MKPTILLAFAITMAITIANAQDGRSPFRKGYTRLGIQNIGNTIDGNQSVKANMLKGNWGTDMGYVLEKGRIFYFIPPAKAKLINAGLDWTIFSLTYNGSAKGWKKYVDVNSGYSEDDFSAKLIASASTKLGPVISINPVQDLVIDVRAQVSLGVYAAGPIFEQYTTGGEGKPVKAFYPYKEEEEVSGIKQFTQYLSTTGIKPNIGATARWRGIGLAADYSPGKVKMIYTATEAGVATRGSEKVPLNSMQVKLSLTF